MFNHPFAYVMAGTFVAAIGALLIGMFNLAGAQDTPDTIGKSTRSNSLMFLRVALCFALLIEIIIYILYIKPHL